MILVRQILFLLVLLWLVVLGWTFLFVAARRFFRRWGFPGVVRWARTPPGPIAEDLRAVAACWREAMELVRLRRRRRKGIVTKSKQPLLDRDCQARDGDHGASGVGGKLCPPTSAAAAPHPSQRNKRHVPGPSR